MKFVENMRNFVVNMVHADWNRAAAVMTNVYTN